MHEEGNPESELQALECVSDDEILLPATGRVSSEGEFYSTQPREG